MNPIVAMVAKEVVKEGTKQQSSPLQKIENTKQTIFGNSIQNNMNNLDNVMANAQNRRPMQYTAPQPIQYNSQQLMQRQYMPSAFTNNNGRII